MQSKRLGRKNFLSVFRHKGVLRRSKQLPQPAVAAVDAGEVGLSVNLLG